MTVHPITLEVVRNALVAFSEEMATALCRSAHNMMIYEVRDFCCGLIDTGGNLISQNSGGLPIFLADLGVIVAASRQRRQMVQRMGRVLRIKSDRRPARFAILYVEHTSEDPTWGAHQTFLSEIVELADSVKNFSVSVPSDFSLPSDRWVISTTSAGVGG